MKTSQWRLSLVGWMTIATLGAALAIAQPARADDAPPDDGKLRIIAFGGHPDDCETFCGGTTRMWADAGHHVKFVSATNGDVGHWQMAGGPLAVRRLHEVQAAARILGNTVQVLDIHDGEIEPTLAEIVSQFIEGGCGGGPQRMPRDADDLRAKQEQLKQGWMRQRQAAVADRHRQRLIELFGEQRGKQIRYAEAFEVCEYGRRPSPEELRKLFPIAEEE